jgi:hypothetical protein
MVNSKIDWAVFHDATLEAIVVDWASGQAKVRMLLSGEFPRVGELVVWGVTLVHCPRRQPWGPSISINEVRAFKSSMGKERIELEIQSGDVVELEGDRVEFRTVAGGHGLEVKCLGDGTTHGESGCEERVVREALERACPGGSARSATSSIADPNNSTLAPKGGYNRGPAEPL